MEEVRFVIEQLFRREYGRISAVLIRHLGDFDLAEESIQEALAVSLERWPIEGIPGRPDAWIYVVARRKALDILRRDRVRAHKYRAFGGDMVSEPGGDPEGENDSGIPDERLRLMFTCCHPALKTETQIALTLRTLGGLTTFEIAQAFVMSESTLAQRLVRAKHKIREAGIPFATQEDVKRPERLSAVMAVVYLIFNEGYYSQTNDQLVRTELADEAIRLGRLLTDLLPEDPEPLGLLSLMLLQNSRARARVGPEGTIVLLEDQDRSLWDVDQIREGLRVLDRAISYGKRGPYQIQAAIAALHAQALRPENTDWLQIVLLYQALSECTPSLVVELNKAAAVAMAFGPDQGLALMDRPEMSEALADYRWFHSSRGDLLRRLGRVDEAREAYTRAMALSVNATERDFLEKRMKELRTP